MIIEEQPEVRVTGSATPTGWSTGTSRDVYNYLTGLQDKMLLALSQEMPEEYAQLRERYTKTAAANPDLMDYLDRVSVEDARSNPERADRARRALPAYVQQRAKEYDLPINFETDPRTRMYWMSKYGLQRDEADVQQRAAAGKLGMDTPEYAMAAIERRQIETIAAENARRGISPATTGIEFKERKRDASALMHELALVPSGASGAVTADSVYSGASTAWSMAGKIRATGVDASTLLGVVKNFLPPVSDKNKPKDPQSTQRGEYGSDNVGGALSVLDAVVAVASDMDKAAKLAPGSSVSPALFVNTLGELTKARTKPFSSVTEGLQYVRDAARWYEMASSGADAAVDSLVTKHKLDTPDARLAVRDAYMKVSAAANRLVSPEDASASIGRLSKLTGIDESLLRDGVMGTDATSTLSPNTGSVDRYIAQMGLKPRDVSGPDRDAVAEYMDAQTGVKQLAAATGVKTAGVLGLGKTVSTLTSAAGQAQKAGSYDSNTAKTVAASLAELSQLRGTVPAVAEQLAAAASQLTKAADTQTARGGTAYPSPGAAVDGIIRASGVDPASSKGTMLRETLESRIRRSVSIKAPLFSTESSGATPAEHFARKGTVVVGGKSIALSDVLTDDEIANASSAGLTPVTRVFSVDVARGVVAQKLLTSGLLTVTKDGTVALDTDAVKARAEARLNAKIPPPVITLASGESFNLGDPKSVTDLVAKYGGPAQEQETRSKVLSGAAAAYDRHAAAREKAAAVLVRYGVEDIDTAVITAALGGKEQAAGNAAAVLDLLGQRANPKLAEELEKIAAKHRNTMELVQKRGELEAGRQRAEQAFRASEADLDRAAKSGSAYKRSIIALYREQSSNGAVDPEVAAAVQRIVAAPGAP